MIATQKHGSYSSEDADKIIMLHNNGVTAREIAAQMGRTTNAINQFLYDRRKREAKIGREVKPAEWSEEDEEMLGIVLNMVVGSTVVSYSSGQLHLSERYKKDITNWLKSLRPQPHWKPSEEQMEALDNARFCKSYDRSELDLLYEDLKKI